MIVFSGCIHNLPICVAYWIAVLEITYVVTVAGNGTDTFELMFSNMTSNKLVLVTILLETKVIW